MDGEGWDCVMWTFFLLTLFFLINLLRMTLHIGGGLVIMDEVEVGGDGITHHRRGEPERGRQGMVNATSISAEPSLPQTSRRKYMACKHGLQRFLD